MTALALASAPTHIPTLIARLRPIPPVCIVAEETSPPLSAFNAQPEASPDGWLNETLERIERYRKYVDGWDGKDALAPSQESLETGEYLTALFADWPTLLRPTLTLDMDGRPTFAARADEFYLHLIVESPQQLTWFAVVQGVEYFKDEVPFDGTSLPGELAELAALWETQ